MATLFLGDNSGIQHKYIDTDVVNGKKYFYALVAYDVGDSELDIFPSENTNLLANYLMAQVILIKIQP